MINVCILDYNKFDNAYKLFQAFSEDFKTFIISDRYNVPLRDLPDGCSFIDARDEYPFYTAKFKKAIKPFESEHWLNYKYTLFICSDISIDEFNLFKFIKKIHELSAPLLKNIGIYAPSIKGHAWQHMKNREDSLSMREIPFAEGICLLVHRDILKELHSVDEVANPYGWGLDIYKGFLCKKMDLRCLVDDDIFIEHPMGSAYDTSEAYAKMISWTHSLNNPEFEKFITPFLPT